MKKTMLFCLLCVSVAMTSAQTETYDLATYTPPQNWKKEVKQNTYTSYAITREQSYCQIFVMHSTRSKGGIRDDFQNEWQTLIVNQYKVTDTPRIMGPTAQGNWQLQVGIAPFTFNNGSSMVMLNTMSGHDRTVSIVAITNSEEFLPAIDTFLASVELKEPSNDPQGSRRQANPETREQPARPAATGGYHFATTHFDDGWVGTEQPDWVHVSKGTTVVRIHYAQPDIRSFSNLDESTAFVWDTLVAPRYGNIANLWIRKSWWADGGFMDGKYFAQADLTENATGKRVHVALYRNGNGGKWLEFVTPDKASFERQFTVVQPQDGTDWNKLTVMGNYNKFAVAAVDLPGRWYSAGGSGVQYYNVYTGNNAGMAFSSSSTELVFSSDGTYKSVYKGVDNTLNNTGTRYHGETYNGTYTVANWEMKLTNRFKGATDTFAVQFEAVKGGRILHMYRGTIEELHLFRMK